MAIKVIKTDADYATALAAIEKLMDFDPDPGTRDADELELLTLLVRDYEQKTFEQRLPDPIEAIRFRMEQQGLTQRDLVPLIGSRSKVSEVLARKRPLTLSMIRSLHSALGIPARALLQGRSQSVVEPLPPDWKRFPIKEILAREWVSEPAGDREDSAEQTIRKFLAPLGSSVSLAALYKRTKFVRTARSIDLHALAAWTARVMVLALESAPTVEYRRGTVSRDFMTELARLSWSEAGPRLASEFLRKHGIAFVIEPHMPRTHIDGAAMTTTDERPIVALTLRHDRIDNFWFCLMHELAHVALHLEGAKGDFYDDLDVEAKADPREQEADELAGEALIPRSAWNKSPARVLRSPEAVQHLSSELRIHPAIVAGRMRHEYKNFRLLTQLVGHGEVRKCFSDVRWRD